MSWPASPANSGSASRPFGTGCRQAEIDVGSRPGVTTEDKGRIAELEKELRELRRANAHLEIGVSFLRLYVTIPSAWWVGSFLRCPAPVCGLSSIRRPPGAKDRSA